MAIMVSVIMQLIIFIIWLVNSPVVSTVELASEMLQEDKQSRPWWKIKPTNIPETRYMDINVVKYSENCFLVLVASSDTFLR